ncbi:MAG: iron-containing alcohol dehydrogenase, partial [Chloroflexi bacterium]|nr:iron-containing alcohol dehydrogenase [Chloroflexota bacterium]
TDNQLEKIGLLDEIKKSLEVSGIAFDIYDKVITEPTIDYTEDGLKAYQQAKAEFLIAVGGGSPLDTGKAISALATNPGKMNDFEGPNKIPKPGAPLFVLDGIYNPAALFNASALSVRSQGNSISSRPK